MTFFNSFFQQISSNNQNLLQNFVINSDFPSILTRILKDKNSLIEIANNSTIHSNKFSKIVLAKNNGWKLRLHIWPVVNYEQVHEPHNHRWDFDSYILSGTMINQIVVENNSNNTYLKCLAHETKINSNRQYDVLNKVGINIVKEEIYNIGETYHMKHEKIHIAKIPQNILTSTLFLTHPAKTKESIVYMPNCELPPSKNVLNSLKIEELESKIQIVLNNL